MLASIYPTMLLSSCCSAPAFPTNHERARLNTTSPRRLWSCIHHTHKMPNTLSLDFKSSALLISLVLVPIVVLFCSVAVALVCAERCSCRRAKPSWLSCLPCRGSQYRKKRHRSDLESAGTGIRVTESSDAPLQFEEPIASREQM